MPFCDSCGVSNRAGARFCSACGQKFSESGTPPGTPPDVESTETLTRFPAKPGVPQALCRALEGTYEIERLLGRGGMGAVYLAKELALDRLVALKVILEDRDEPEAVERFLSEARLAARLRHPNIVSIHAVGRQGGVNFFTMDYVEGRPLDTHVEEAGHGNGLAPGEARRIVAGICQAVAHAHRMGVVHRDLKPGNVMIERGGHVVVMDFGLAKAIDAAAVTASGVIVGTPSYISPEQLQGHPASPKSDLYAVGLIFYFVLTGRRLVQGDSLTAVVSQHISGVPAAKLATDSLVPLDLRPLMLSMVQRDPELRPASLDDVLAKLQPAAHAEIPTAALQPVTERPVTPVPAAAPDTSRRTPSSDPVKRQAREKMKGLLDKLSKDGSGPGGQG